MSNVKRWMISYGVVLIASLVFGKVLPETDVEVAATSTAATDEKSMAKKTTTTEFRKLMQTVMERFRVFPTKLMGNQANC